MVLMTCCGTRFNTVRDTMNHVCHASTGLINFPHWVTVTPCNTHTQTFHWPTRHGMEKYLLHLSSNVTMVEDTYSESAFDYSSGYERFNTLDDYHATKL